MTTIPTLESERLILRPFHEDDFDSMAEFFANPISRFYGGPCDRAAAWRKFAAYPGHWALRGYGPWALEAKENGSFLGLCGPWYPEGWIEPEITWALAPGHHGKGFATDSERHLNPLSNMHTDRHRFTATLDRRPSCRFISDISGVPIFAAPSESSPRERSRRCLVCSHGI